MQSGRGVLVLLGDSRAAMLQPALEEVARRLGKRLEVATRAGCPFIEGGADDCQRSVAATVKYLTRHASLISGVVVNQSSPEYAPGADGWTPTRYPQRSSRSFALWLQAVGEPIQTLRGTESGCY